MGVTAPRALWVLTTRSRGTQPHAGPAPPSAVTPARAPVMGADGKVVGSVVRKCTVSESSSGSWGRGSLDSPAEPCDESWACWCWWHGHASGALWRWLRIRSAAAGSIVPDLSVKIKAWFIMEVLTRNRGEKVSTCKMILK